MLKQSLNGRPSEWEKVQEETLLYPNESKLIPESLPQNIKKSYIQASRALKASLFEPCVLMSRKCLEAVCEIFNAKGNNLNKRLSQLQESGHIDFKLLNWAHEIRLIANEAAHDTNTPITKDDARDVLDFTEAILIYVFSLTKRFEDLKVRRLKNKKNRINKT